MYAFIDLLFDTRSFRTVFTFWVDYIETYAVSPGRNQTQDERPYLPLYE